MNMHKRAISIIGRSNRCGNVPVEAALKLEAIIPT